MAHRIKTDPVTLLQRSPRIGRTTAKALVSLGIETDQQLAEQDPVELSDRLRKLKGKTAKHIAMPGIAAVIEDLRSSKEKYGCYPNERFLKFQGLL